MLLKVVTHAAMKYQHPFQRQCDIMRDFVRITRPGGHIWSGYLEACKSGEQENGDSGTAYKDVTCTRYENATDNTWMRDCDLSSHPKVKKMWLRGENEHHGTSAGNLDSNFAVFVDLHDAATTEPEV